MRLESALYTSQSGLYSMGQAMSVTSDNIANANTTGFKESRAEFADIMVEGADGYRSSADPATGSGVRVSDIRTIFANGDLEITGRELDVGIDGNGFFIVGDPAAPNYTRDGGFSIDVDGFLVNKDGRQVLGYGPGGTTLAPIDMTNVSLVGAQTTTATMTGNLNATSPVGTVLTAPATFNEIAQNASFVSNLTAYDSLGAQHDFTIAFTKTGTNAWTVQAYIDGGDVTGGTAGVPFKVGQDLNLTFSENGIIPEANQAAALLTLAPAYSNGAAAGNFTVDVSGFSQFAAPPDLKSFNQDGKASGNLEGYEFTADGQVQAVLSSGARQTLATVQLADFVSEDGLTRSGSSIFSAGIEAGDRTVAAPGTGALGTIKGGALERSTVDLSTQFVGLVVLQRAYQANSKCLNSANDTLRDTIGLMR